MKVIIAGDTAATESNLKLFQKDKVTDLVGQKIYEKLHAADIVIANLEAPLYDGKNIIKKYGPHLAASNKSVEGLLGLNINVANMANNHIMDHGISGLENTCRVLKAVKINYLGIGKNIDEMKDILCCEVNDCKIGIYSCTEHEFSCAGRKYPGANPYDPLISFDRVLKLSAKCDYVIVLYHGGNECYRLPSPELQRKCRKFIDSGANFVVTQHSHCIGAKEIYNNGEILYGQGNFIFDRTNNEYTQSGLLVSINILGREKSKIEYVPFVKKNEKIRAAENNEKEEIMKMFEENSLRVDDRDYLDAMYDAFAMQNAKIYLSGIHGNNLLSRVMNKLTVGRYIPLFYKNDAGLGALNYIRCESHRELLIRIIKKNLIG